MLIKICKQALLNSAKFYDVLFAPQGLFLDLCLNAETFAKTRRILSEGTLKDMDFSQFLDFYARFSGLLEKSSDIAVSMGYKSYWIPRVNGIWKEVKGFLLFCSA